MDIRTQYEVTVTDFDSGITVHAMVLPGSSLDPEARGSFTVENLRQIMPFDGEPVDVSNESLVSTLVQTLTGSDLRPTDPVSAPPEVLNLAAYLAYGDWLPWESSPPSAKSLATVMASCLAAGTPIMVGGTLLGLGALVLICAGGVLAFYVVTEAIGPMSSDALNSAIRGIREAVRRLFGRLRRKNPRERELTRKQEQRDKATIQHMEELWPVELP